MLKEHLWRVSDVVGGFEQPFFAWTRSLQSVLVPPSHCDSLLAQGRRVERP